MNRQRHKILPACVLKSHVLHVLAICFTSQSHKKHPKNGCTKTNKPTDMFLPTQHFRKQKSHRKTRPFNIDPCRCRCPNLHNPLRSVGNRSFSSSDSWTSRANGSFSKKSYKICDQKKLFGDPRTIWKTYQKILHALTACFVRNK